MTVWMYNLPTARKLMLGFGLCLSLALLVGAVAVTRMAQMNSIAENIISDSLTEVADLADFQGEFQQVRIVEYRHALSTTPADKAKAAADLSVAQAEADKSLASYQGTFFCPPTRKTTTLCKPTGRNIKRCVVPCSLPAARAT